MTPPDLFRGEVKKKILSVLAAQGGAPIDAALLCEKVYGDRERPHRDSLRNVIKAMKPRLEEHGWHILGRKELRRNAYQLEGML